MRKLILVFFALPLLAISCVPPGAQSGGGGSMFSTILPFVLIFGLFYFLIIRPQQKQSRERKKMLAEVKRGDSVLTNGGIYGKIVNVKDDELTVEIAKGINIRMARAAISEKISSATDNVKTGNGKSTEGGG